ncbi:MAG: phosphatidylglycerophosphatase A [Nitrospirae bacterium]|nr:phosphatidylglycerophosphatase A [Nitrospirota bacterium]
MYSVTIRAVMQVLLKNIATLGPIGYIPFGPGTFGSLAGLICLWFFPLSLRWHFLLIIIGSIIGAIAATSAEKQFGQKDSGKIIVDEFIGFYVTTLYVPHTSSLLVAGFILFRLFDIFKPLMIKKLEKTLTHGKGVMADDILAGIYANALLQVWMLLNP